MYVLHFSVLFKLALNDQKHNHNRDMSTLASDVQQVSESWNLEMWKLS